MDSESIKVTEHWRMIQRKRLLVMFKDGTIYPFEEGEEEKHDEYHPARHGKTDSLSRAESLPAHTPRCTSSLAFDILAGPYEWKMIVFPSSGWLDVPSRSETACPLRPSPLHEGPARLRNFWRSVAAEQLGYAPKAQWLATESAVEGREDSSVRPIRLVILYLSSMTTQ
jgi:hypothetical protein